MTVAANWDHLRAFLATAEGGSFSAAARTLGQAQPTVGRQVAALEAALGVLLFERLGRRLVLTPTGADLLAHAREMGGAADRIALIASGRSGAAEGVVSVSVSDVLAATVMPDIVAGLARTAPGLVVDVVATNAVSDLQRREADLAIRHLRPDGGDLVARHLGDGTAHLWGATALLDRLGRPPDLSAAPFVSFATVDQTVREFGRVGLAIEAAQVRSVSTSGLVAWEMVRRGIGLSPMADAVGRRTPGVEPLPPDSFAPVRFPFWLTAHREVRTARRVRIVWDALAEGFGAILREDRGQERPA